MLHLCTGVLSSALTMEYARGSLSTKKISKLPLKQEDAVSGCSQILEEFDQQIQEASNNIYLIWLNYLGLY
jgi:hypothetical protein